MGVRAALFGTGHIGGSLLYGLRAAGWVDFTVGYDLHPAAAERARARGIVDAVEAGAAAAARGARLVVIATPVAAIGGVARAIAGALDGAALVIDVGSLKERVVADVEAALPDPSRFVGCHPIAGREASGPDAADGDLFRGRPCLITPTARTAPAAIAEAIALWEAVGARVEQIDPGAHDARLAASSHLPHVAAFVLSAALGRALDEAEAGAIAALGATSLRDTTRVAASDPATWRDILAGNRERLLPLVDALAAELAALRSAIERGDGPALLETIGRARSARSRLCP